MRRSLRLPGLALALAVAAAACTGGGDGDDATPTPSPTPVFDADACQIVFLNRVDAVSIVELWVVDVPVADWVQGTHLYAVPGGPTELPSGQWYENYDVDTGAWTRSAVATTGEFVLAAVTQSTGAFVRLVDDEPQPIWTIGTAGLIAFQGTSGAGTFQGLLSDPYSASVTAGEGAVTILIDGTSRELGQDLSYAVCYRNTTLARPERTRETLRRLR